MIQKQFWSGDIQTPHFGSRLYNSINTPRLARAHHRRAAGKREDTVLGCGVVIISVDSRCRLAR
jgi:hypothetical protein